MRHFVDFDPVLGREPVWLDGREVVGRLPELPEQAWLNGPSPRREERFTGARPAEAGRPYAIHEDGSLNQTINRFVSYLLADGVAKRSAKMYLYDLRKFERWLSTFDLTLVDATSVETQDFRSLCLEGDLAYRISRSSWSRFEVAIDRFYSWGVDAERLVEKKPKCRFRRRGAKSENTVRMVPLDQYIAFRNLGILGANIQGPDGVCRSSQTPLRDAAYAELGITSGMRQQEKASLLLCELPSSDAAVFKGKGSTALTVPETVAKYQKRRDVPLSKRVLTEFVEPYIREERALLVDRWRRSGGATRPDVLLGWLDARGRAVLAADPSAPRLVASLTISERRRLVLLPHKEALLSDASPASLWLSQRGDPMATEGWSAVLRRASERLRRNGGDPIYITDHMLRHSFAVHWLSRLIKIQMEREHVDELPRDRVSSVYLKVVGDPLRKIQHWLGHASSLTTQIYLTYVDEALEEVQRGTEMFDKILGYVGDFDGA